MSKTTFSIIALVSIVLFSGFAADWGFFGHRRINRMAVFTLPAEMIGFYKKNIEFITEHAVDPDKRRYATKHEAVRHYIDIDHWDTYPFDKVPRNLVDAVATYAEVYIETAPGDTILLFSEGERSDVENDIIFKGKGVRKHLGLDSAMVNFELYRDFINRNYMPNYYEDDQPFQCEEINGFLTQMGFPEVPCHSAYGVDIFSEMGILPYHLLKMQERLTEAFIKKDLQRILQLSAEFGHYIGDAHVPLHTTENYNGQMTDQVGIHGFWESRLPELFADKEFDYFVGPAEYIANPQTYYWDIVLKSHSYLDSLLAIEKDLSIRFPQDKQYCYEGRLERTIRTQCEGYAAEYRKRLDGQVESRMVASIKSIGSVWYTCWVNAGQPELDFSEIELDEEYMKMLELEEKLFREGQIKGRKHDQ